MKMANLVHKERPVREEKQALLVTMEHPDRKAHQARKDLVGPPAQWAIKDLVARPAIVEIQESLVCADRPDRVASEAIVATPASPEESASKVEWVIEAKTDFPASQERLAHEALSGSRALKGRPVNPVLTVSMEPLGSRDPLALLVPKVLWEIRVTKAPKVSKARKDQKETPARQE